MSQADARTSKLEDAHFTLASAFGDTKARLDDAISVNEAAAKVAAEAAEGRLEKLQATQERLTDELIMLGERQHAALAAEREERIAADTEALVDAAELRELLEADAERLEAEIVDAACSL